MKHDDNEDEGSRVAPLTASPSTGTTAQSASGSLAKCSCQTLAYGTCCDTCRYGVCPGCTFPNEIDCRRHAPTLDVRRGRWPKVSRSDWCGDYEAFRPPASVAASDPHVPDPGKLTPRDEDVPLPFSESPF